MATIELHGRIKAGKLEVDLPNGVPDGGVKVLIELVEEKQFVEATKPRRSLYGLWAGVRITDEDIQEVRREMLGNFPRDDI